MGWELVLQITLFILTASCILACCCTCGLGCIVMCDDEASTTTKPFCGSDKCLAARMLLHIWEGGVVIGFFYFLSIFGVEWGAMGVLLTVTVYCVARTTFLFREMFIEVVLVPSIEDEHPLEWEVDTDDNYAYLTPPSLYTVQFKNMWEDLVVALLVFVVQSIAYAYVLIMGTYDLIWHGHLFWWSEDVEVISREAYFRNLFAAWWVCSVLRSLMPSFLFAPAKEDSEWFFWRHYLFDDVYNQKGQRVRVDWQGLEDVNFLRLFLSLMSNEVFFHITLLLFPFSLCRADSALEFVKDMTSIIFISLLDNMRFSKGKHWKKARAYPKEVPTPTAQTRAADQQKLPEAAAAAPPPPRVAEQSVSEAPAPAAAPQQMHAEEAVVTAVVPAAAAAAAVSVRDQRPASNDQVSALAVKAAALCPSCSEAAEARQSDAEHEWQDNMV